MGAVRKPEEALMATSKKIRKSARADRPTRGRVAAKPSKKPRRSATKKAAEPAPRPATKQAALLALLQRREGATIEQMCAKTGWQAHSVRAALTGLRKRGVGITRAKNDAGDTVYRVAEV